VIDIRVYYMSMPLIARQGLKGASTVVTRCTIFIQIEAAKHH
jgi:hypothetical protein